MKMIDANIAPRYLLDDTYNPVILKSALELYRNRNIDIVDAILCSYYRLEHLEIFIFDKKLMKCLQSTE